MRATPPRVAGFLFFSFLVTTFAPKASAYCRTMTCSSQVQSCPRDANECVIAGQPIAWAGKCVGFDLQKRASVRVTLDDATHVVAAAFNAWRSVTCPAGGHPSLQIFDLGPVACDQVQYNANQGNANIVVFRDQSWPHPTGLDTDALALTTVTFDMDSGEIYDADMEVNGTNPLTTSTPPPAGGYDLQAILTHEAGHFLGLAHSSDPDATMFARYRAGTYNTRVPSPDDVAAICAAYPPNRQVPSTCDPTPHHGFMSDCASPLAAGSGCALVRREARTNPRRSRTGIFASAALLGIAALVRARRRLSV